MKKPHEFHDKMSHRFLVFLGIEEPTPKQIRKLKDINYKELICPLVLEDRSRGLTMQQIAIKYRMSFMQCRYIIEKSIDKT